MEDKRMAKGWQSGKGVVQGKKNELGDKLSFQIGCVGEYG
jgi:hypothetical protein